MALTAHQASLPQSTTSQKLIGTALRARVLTYLKQRFDRAAIRQRIFLYIWRTLGLNVVTRADMVQQGDRYRVMLFGTAHQFVATPPSPLESTPPIIAALAGPVQLEQPFVAELQHVQLVGPTAVCIGGDRSIFMESVLPNGDNGNPGFEGLPLRTLLRREMTRFDAPTLDTVCSFVNPWGRVYAHWLCEGLTRFEGLEYYQQLTGQSPTLLIHPNPSKWQVESLQLMGYNLDQFVQWQGGRIKVNRLVLPSFRRQCRWSDPAAYRWVRDRMLQHLPPQQDPTLTLSPRIFISRSGSHGRRIINEPEVMDLLARFGFVSYVTEKLSFADEVRLFLQAEVVIGTHGSGFSNIIFSEHQPLVIDLYSSWLSGSFFQLTASMGSRYRYLSCEPRGENTGYKDSDMWVDITRLQQLLEGLVF